jgi:hypothetical protein
MAQSTVTLKKLGGPVVSLLDELRKEARDIQSGNIQVDSQQKADAAFYHDHLRLSMLQAHKYFAEVIENLNIIEPEIHPDYPFSPSIKDPVFLSQSGYKLLVDDLKEPHQIDILCSATLGGTQEFFVRTKDAVEKHASLLESYEFPFHRKNFLDEQYEVRGATFLLEGPLRIHIRIKPHLEERCIHIYLRNLEDKPLKRHRFQPESVNEELLERLAQVLLRKQAQLVEVNVSDEVRSDLRRQLAAEDQRKQQELDEAYAASESERIVAREARLIYRVKRWLLAKARSFVAKRVR